MKNDYTLRDGNTIPCIGFGSYNAKGDDCRRAAEAALAEGYRYIDTAEFYGNEEQIGEAAADSGVDREELYLLTKAWPTSYDNLEEAAHRSASKLRVDYLDTLLLHWPGMDETRRLKAYEQLLALREKGIIRTAGVSNFFPDQIEKLKEEFGDYPPLIELEIHPGYQQRGMVSWCQERGIRVIAYSPINRGADLTNETVKTLAARYEKTPAQIVLRWHLQKGRIPIPKSANPVRIRENRDIFDFELTEKDMAEIDALECGAKSGQDARVFPGI